MWLSTDDRHHPMSDLNLNFKIPDGKPFTSPLTESGAAIDLSGAYVLPGDIDDKFCGTVYLLVVLDPSDAVQETDEMNNVASVPVTLPCRQSGECSFSKCVRVLMYLLRSVLDFVPPGMSIE